MTDKNPTKPKLNLDELLRRADEEDAKPRDPLEAQVLIGDRVITVRMPFLRRDPLDSLLNKHIPHPAYRDKLGCWFDLDSAVADHPDIVLIDGDEESDLWELQDREAVYRWPEVYRALSGDDKRTLQASFWGLYVYEPRQRLKEIQTRESSE